MYIALISIIIFICILLVLVVLSQNSKGGGLSSQFGAGSSQLMGVKRTGDLLEKLTWGLAIALIVLSLGAQMVPTSGEGNGQPRSVNMEKASQQKAPAAVPIVPPAGGNNATGTTERPAVSTPGLTTDSAK
jgi:preprotein translocase subunit SecG